MSYVYQPEHVYRGTICQLVDGDTWDIYVDQGFGSEQRIRVRLYGINTPEIHGVKKDSDEYERGQLAMEWLRANNFGPGNDVWFHSHKPGKFGRWLAVIWPTYDALGELHRSVNARLLKAELAKLYTQAPLEVDLNEVGP